MSRSSPSSSCKPTGTAPIPWFFNPFAFSGGSAGTGDWTGDSPPIVTVTSMGLTITVTLDYAGREIDRRWCNDASDPNCATPIPEPQKSLGLAAGLTGVAALALFHGRRRNS